MVGLASTPLTGLIEKGGIVTSGFRPFDLLLSHLKLVILSSELKVLISVDAQAT